MSYQRWGYPLEWFKTGESKSYVFCHVDGFVEDYNDTYDDDKSFCELIYRIVLCETEDKKYAEKILRVLAKKLGIEDELKEGD